MDWRMTMRHLVLVLFLAFSLNGCLAAAAGYAGGKLAQGGSDTYVCESAPTGPSLSALEQVLESGSENYIDYSGDKVEILQKTSTDAGGQSRIIALVESESIDDRTYWVPLNAICSM